MEKILIKDNAEKAENRINDVDAKYIARLNTLASAIGSLNIGTPTKEMIVDAIFNNSALLKIALDKAIESQIKESNVPDLLQASINKESNERLKTVFEAASTFHDGTTLFNGIRIDSQKLVGSFDVDESGEVTFNESAKDAIREGTKEYIKTKDGIKMYNLQQALAKNMQDLYDLMESVELSKEVQLNSFVRGAFYYAFPMHLINVREDRNTGKRIFEPVTYNFDPDKRDE